MVLPQIHPVFSLFSSPTVMQSTIIAIRLQNLIYQRRFSYLSDYTKRIKIIKHFSLCTPISILILYSFFNLKTLINCKKIAAISSVFGIPKTEVKENFTFIFIQNIFRLIIFSNLKKKKRMSLCHKDFVFQRLTISNIICILNFDMGQLNF